MDEEKSELRPQTMSEPEQLAGGSQLPTTRIDALIRLLGDDNPKIVTVAREHLSNAIGVTKPYIVEQSTASDDPRVRKEAQRLLTDIGRQQQLAVWREFAQSSGPLDLETGAFLIAKIEYPGLDVGAYRRQLDDLGTVLGRRVSLGREPDSIVSKLVHLLFREAGFRGNRKQYYEPENSYLNRVLDRKLGIPISLSTLCILVARRVGLELDGVGMPRHFIVRYHVGRKERYFDPFNGGRHWSLEDCVQYLRGEGYGFREEYLRAYSPREILIRMLANLLHIFKSREDDEPTRRTVDMLVALNPEQESTRA